MKRINDNAQKNISALENFNQEAEAQIVNKGLEDVKEGRIIDGEKTLEEIKEKYSL